MAGRGKPAVVLAILAIGSASALVACGSSDAGSPSTTTEANRSFRPATEAGSLQGPGTEIADGIHVQPGSSLVGAAFPVIDPSDDSPQPSGWQAVIAVQGDPIAVWDAYAGELGIDDVAGAKEACTVSAPPQKGAGAAKQHRFLTEAPLEGEVRLACSARIGDLSASLVTGVVGCVRPDVSDDPCELRSGSALYLRQAPEGPRSSSADPALGTDRLRRDRPIPDGPIIAPDLERTGPSNLPGEGERIDDGIDHFLGTGSAATPPAVLPAGAKSLIAPAMLIDCSSGLVAAVGVPLPPAEALAAFPTGGPEGTSPVRTGDRGGRAWATRSFDAVGGYELQLTAVHGAEDGTSFVLATECGD